MKIKKKLTAGALVAAVLILPACSKRQIDPVESGSVPVPGTSWMMFCDGPNAVIWVPGVSGDADELEAYVYEHHECAPDFYGEAVLPQQGDRPADDDGISEEED
jgi:hypothetical protein